MAGRRANQEGSVFQRPDGQWVAQVTTRDKDGKRRMMTRWAQTQGEARRKLTDLKTRQDSGRLVATGRATVRQWLDTWVELYVKPNRAPRTYECYNRILRDHIPDHIGRLTLGRLAPEVFQKHFTAIAESGLGRTAELLRSVLRAAFNKAIRLRRLEVNPISGTDPVKFERQVREPFTADEARAFMAAAVGHRLEALFVVALSLGLRKGEVLGLKEDDLDLNERIIHVRRSLAWLKLPGEKKGRWFEREPKWGSRRDLPMTETIYRLLVRHLAQRQEEQACAAEKWKGASYLFVTALGEPIHGKNLTEEFHRVCDAAGVPKIPFHAARHSCGTLLHTQGADPFTIQKVLGHSQLSTTRRYTHVPIAVTKAALDGLETLLATPLKAATAAQPVPSQLQ